MPDSDLLRARPRAAASDAPRDGAAAECRVRRTLRRRLRAALRDAARAGTPTLRRVEVALPDGTDPLAWLHAQDATAASLGGGTSPADAVFWSGRGSDALALAGLGAADVVALPPTALDDAPLASGVLARRLRRLPLADAPAARYLGGLRFDARPRAAGEASGDGAAPSADALDAAWQPFAAARFVLPRVEVQADAAGHATLAIHVVGPDDGRRAGALLGVVDRLALPAADAPLPAQPALAERTDAPPRADWLRLLADALARIDAGALDKIVLARRATFGFDEPLDALALLRRLRPATPACFHFAFRPAGHDATFLGASPERLLHLDGRTVTTEAVAGTRARGASAQADAALRDELLASEKDRREHAFVQDAIGKALGALCTEVTESAPDAMTLARKRHLRARLGGTLRPGVAPLDVAAALHPTPAVGGVPTRAARDAIRAYEPFDRGWYAGPVGWLRPDAADLAVALRCGLAHGSRLALFSGAGIVHGSDPASEWDEIEQKIGDFAAVLGLPRSAEMPHDAA